MADTSVAAVLFSEDVKLRTGVPFFIEQLRSFVLELNRERNIIDSLCRGNGKQRNLKLELCHIRKWPKREFVCYETDLSQSASVCVFGVGGVCVSAKCLVKTDLYFKSPEIL